MLYKQNERQKMRENLDDVFSEQAPSKKHSCTVIPNHHKKKTRFLILPATFISYQFEPAKKKKRPINSFVSETTTRPHTKSLENGRMNQENAVRMVKTKEYCQTTIAYVSNETKFNNK